MTEQNLQTTDPKSLDNAALETAALHHIDRIRVHGRNMVTAAWNAGQYLTEMKHRSDHGQWIDWLGLHSINPRLAQRFMKIGEILKTDVPHFDTLDEAYQSTKQIEASTVATPEPPFDHPEIPEQPAPLTSSEKRIIEMDQLRSEPRTLSSSSPRRSPSKKKPSGSPLRFSPGPATRKGSSKTARS